MKQNIETEDCINCICHTLFRTGMLIGIHHTKSQCEHGKNYFVQYKRSNISITIGIVLFITVILIAIHNIRDLFLNGFSYSQQNIIFKIGLIVFQVNVLFSLSGQILRANLIVKERQFFFDIIHDKQFYGIKSFINKKDGLFLRFYTRFFVICTIIIIIVVVIAEIFYLENYKFWTIYNAMVSCTYMLVETIFCLTLLIKTKLYVLVITKTFEQIKIVLNERLQIILNDEHSIDNQYGKLLFPTRKITRMDFPIHNKLQKLQALHCRIMKSFRRYIDSINPLILTHLTAHIAIFILNYYLLILIWLTGNSVHSITLKQIETNVILLVTVLLTLENEKLYVPAENIINFFDSFPVHKLTPKEINQVAILKISIQNIGPEINASDLFNCRINLLGTIAATVISYVLLILQFRATWNEYN